MADCLFCKILAGDIPADKVYEDDKSFAFNDINPQAPHHVLIIPREHIESLNQVDESNEALIGHLCAVASKIAKDLGVSEGGYRTVFNTNKDAGQEVFHIHLHLLAGRKLSWPPG